MNLKKKMLKALDSCGHAELLIHAGDDRSTKKERDLKTGPFRIDLA